MAVHSRGPYRRLIAATAVGLCTVAINAETFVWVASAEHTWSTYFQWHDPANWEVNGQTPSGPPGPADDVVLAPAVAAGIHFGNTTAECASFELASGIVRLTYGTLNVDPTGSGVLLLSGGEMRAESSLTVATGSLVLDGASVSLLGQWTASSFDARSGGFYQAVPMVLDPWPAQLVLGATGPDPLDALLGAYDVPAGTTVVLRNSNVELRTAIIDSRELLGGLIAEADSRLKVSRPVRTTAFEVHGRLFLESSIWELSPGLGGDLTLRPGAVVEAKSYTRGSVDGSVTLDAGVTVELDVVGVAFYGGQIVPFLSTGRGISGPLPSLVQLGGIPATLLYDNDTLSYRIDPSYCLPDITSQNARIGDPSYGVPDGLVTGADIQFFVNLWLASDPRADLTGFRATPGNPTYGVPDGSVTASDINLYVNYWVQSCD